MLFVLRHNETDLVLLTEVDLLANALPLLPHKLADATSISVGVVVHENAHDVLRAQLVLRSKIPEVAGCVHEEDLLMVRPRTVFAKDDQAGRNASAVEDVQG